MDDTTRIFAVLDPTCMEQASLQWGEQVVRAYKEHRGIDAILHMYCCIGTDSAALSPDQDAGQGKKNAKVRVAAWLDRLAIAPRAEGLPVVTEVEWSEDWRNAIVVAAAKHRSALVIKNMTPHSRFVRILRETSDWTLIRECECPVLLVKTGRPIRIEKVLVAVKHSPDDETYEKANDNILDTAKRLTADLGADLHAVTGYEPGSHPDRQRLADRCGLARNQVTAAVGAPERVIADTAAQQGSDLVMLARVALPGSPKTIGKTARKVIDEIDTEVLVLPV